MMACYILMEWGWQKYRHLETYQLVDLFLQKGEEVETFYDMEVPLLILYHMRGTMENKQLENLTCHTISQRNLLNLKTIVLAEVDLPQVESHYMELQLPVVKDNQKTQSNPTII